MCSRDVTLIIYTRDYYISLNYYIYFCERGHLKIMHTSKLYVSFLSYFTYITYIIIIPLCYLKY